jgi:thiol-disulfide isomerase/thioredoxin
MEVAHLYFRLLLVAVFSIAAAGKLLDLKGSKKAAIDFGCPKSLATPIAVILPLVEISIAAMLIEESTVIVGAFSSFALLSVFTLLMMWQRSKGNAPDCHCFGAVGSEPVGIVSILRNLVLLVIAFGIAFEFIAGTGRSMFDYRASFLLPLIASAVLPVVLMMLVSYSNGLKRKNIDLESKIEELESVLLNGSDPGRLAIGHPEDGIPVGAPIPYFEAASLKTRDTIALSNDLQIGNHVLVFVGPECGPCAAMLPDLVALKEEFSGTLSVKVVSEGDAERSIEKFSSLGVENIFLQSDKNISSLFLAKWTPAAVLISYGRVASRVAAGELNIRKLFEDQRGKDFSNGTLHTATGIPRSRFKFGEPVPQFSIFSVNGDSITADDFNGTGGIIVFTDASCLHCEIVADSIASIRKGGVGKLGNGFKILFLHSGDATKLETRGLGDCTAIDEGQMLGRLLGAFGTPSAILIDANGKISSETAVGSVAINALLGIHGGKLDR